MSQSNEPPTQPWGPPPEQSPQPQDPYAQNPYAQNQYAQDPYRQVHHQQVHPSQVPYALQPAPQQQVVVRRPGTPVTYGIIAICAAVWLGEIASPSFEDAVVLAPVLGRDEPWRFVTSAFAHASWLHIACNMLALWTLRSLEPFLGRARFAALYLLSALAGGVAYVALATPDTQTWYTGVVGASGAIFGLFGALLIAYRTLKASTRQLWIVLAINAFISFGFPGIAWQAHVGGFLAGAAAGALVVRERQRAGRGLPDRSWLWLGLMAVAVVAVAVVKYAVS